VPVTAGQFPFLVMVLSPGSLCTGSLIDRSWVLTAAHCGLSGTPDIVVISDAQQGVAKPGHTVETLAVKRWIPHPGFDGTLPPDQARDDIALIELAGDATRNPPRIDGAPLYRPQPIALATAPPSTTASIGDVLLAGFGLTDLDVLPPLALWAPASTWPAGECDWSIHAKLLLAVVGVSV